MKQSPFPPLPFLPPSLPALSALRVKGIDERLSEYYLRILSIIIRRLIHKKVHIKVIM